MKRIWPHLKKNISLPVRCISFILTAVAIVSGSATVVRALTVDGTSRSYLSARESVGGNTFLPGYEYLDFSIGDISGDEISVHFGGWARYDFKQEDARQDLQYAFLSYKRKYDNTMVNLGRVMVFEGVAAERVDGIYARSDIAGPALGISAFGGQPAETGIDTPGNNIIYGARLFHQKPSLYTVGLSYLREEKNSSDFREEEGVDLWFRPVDKVELLGRSSYNTVTRGWMEHSYNLVLGPFDKLRFTTQAANVHYKAFEAESTTPALQFTTGLLDPAERATLIGEEVSYAATDTVTVFANYRLYAYKIAGDASSYGGRVNYSHGRGNAAGFAVNRMDGDEKRLKYTEYRLYGARRIGRIELAVDLIDVAFDEDISGTGNSYSATLAAAYELTRSLKLGADVEYQKNPFFDKDVRVFAKIIYSFGTKIGGGV